MIMNNRELQNIYRDTVLEHSRNPHNFGRIEEAKLEAEGFNPLCGDKVSVYINTSDQQIEQCAFEATGCAISMASASLMMDSIENNDLAAVEKLIEQVDRMFTSKDEPHHECAVPALEALGGVRAYPSRIKCATLPWRTLQAALAGDKKTATTE